MTKMTLTNIISFKLSYYSVIGLLSISNAFAANAPGVIANEPLQTSTTAKPNIMFILDNSGSMNDPLDDSTRLAVMQDSAKAIINGLGQVRVGVAKLMNDPVSENDIFPDTPLPDPPYSAYGAAILSNVADLTPAYKAQLGTTIDNIRAWGWTPLASSMRDIGRYFAHGNTTAGLGTNCGGTSGNNATLTLHPDDETPSTIGCTTLLGSTLPPKHSAVTLTGPVTAWCQKSFVVLLTDGLVTQDDTGTNTNLAYYDRDCTPVANSNDTTPADASGYTCDGSADMKTGTSPSVGGTYAYQADLDTLEVKPSDYLDDVAQALFEIDLLPALNDSNNNEVKNNLQTYVIALAEPQLETNPLLKETAKQGGGEFLFADSAANLVSAFSRVTSSIIAQTSNSSAVTFNSSTLSSQSAVYQALFNTASWSGELNSYPLDGSTGEIITDCATRTPVPENCWKAAEKLDAQDPDDRFIIVAGDNTNKYGVEFNYIHGTDDYTNLNSSTDIPQALLSDLCSTPSGTSTGTSFPCSSTDNDPTKTNNSAYLHQLVRYLRGDNSQENTGYKFRPRLHDLGDIVNSSPVFVGVPQQNYPNTGDFPVLTDTSTDYRTWAAATKERPGVVYVASNDGMLHGFRAKDKLTGASENVNTSAGEEVFAFIPSGTFSSNNNEGLHFIADNNYSHRFYNDLSPSIADVYMDYKNSSGVPTGTYSVTTKAKDTSTAQWRTVLLGSQAGGGKSIYLLDVTDPTEYTTSSKQNAKKLVMWEFSSSDADLGYTYSKPTIAMMNNGKFAAIFGNGYNSAGCKAKLFVVFLEGGLDGDWTDTGDYYEYDTGTTYGGGAGDCNGMSTPAVVDLDGNGTADRVYAGDLKGNLWAFDMCKASSALTGDACSRIANPADANGWNIAHAQPLMNANNGTMHDGSQPITSKPVVSIDPENSDPDDLIIVFGTGQYLTDADKSTTGLQRMYGVKDENALANSSAGQNNKWYFDGNLVETNQIKWADTTFTVSGTTRTFDTTETVGDFGWRINLPTSGERVVVNPKIRNNVVFFNTIIPDDTTCNHGGSGWVMSVNLLNGGIPTEPAFDSNGDGIIDSDDALSAGEKLNEIPAESTFLGDNQYTPGSNSSINVRKVNVAKSEREGRMSWKEIFENN